MNSNSVVMWETLHNNAGWDCFRTLILRGILKTQNVEGSFSARMPRSSAEVRRVFVHHIVEDEVDEQKEGQSDQKEDGEEREVNGDVEEREGNQTQRSHENIRWDECGPILEPCMCACISL